MPSIRNKKNGFTLIELLIVIAIVGILTTVVVSSLNKARSKARDTERVQTAKQVKTALELYFSNFGFYPVCAGSTACTSVGAYGDIELLNIVPNYISKINDDPKNGTFDGNHYGYFYVTGVKKTGVNSFTVTGTNTDYVFGMSLENGLDPDYTLWSYTLNYLDGN